MALPFLVQALIGIALLAAGYLLMPRPKAPKPPEMRDADDPESRVKPIPMVFGTVVIRGSNVVWFGRKRKIRRKVKQKSK